MVERRKIIKNSLHVHVCVKAPLNHNQPTNLNQSGFMDHPVVCIKNEQTNKNSPRVYINPYDFIGYLVMVLSYKS